jgi:hypothetical protein
MNLFKPESFKNISIDYEAPSSYEEHKKEPAKDFFCEYWVNGRIALQLASDMIKNPIVKLIIKCCLFLGDGIYERVCK